MTIPITGAALLLFLLVVLSLPEGTTRQVLLTACTYLARLGAAVFVVMTGIYVFNPHLATSMLSTALAFVPNATTTFVPGEFFVQGMIVTGLLLAAFLLVSEVAHARSGRSKKTTQPQLPQTEKRIEAEPNARRAAASVMASAGEYQRRRVRLSDLL